MTVRTSKPALNLREELSRLDKPSGIAGEAMLRAETPQEQFNLIGAGRKNLIINGDFKVHQRGGTVVAGSSDVYTLDRFANRGASVSQSTDVPSGYGFKNSMFYDNDGTRVAINVRHKIEDGFALFDGQDITLSFWIKPTKACRIGVDIHDYYSTGYTIDLQANVWQYKTVTFSALDTGSFTDYWGGHMHFDMNFGDAYPDVYLTGVQLELGSVATPFEHRSYGEELALCQRYYQRITASGYAYRIAAGSWSGPSDFAAMLQLPVPMRSGITFSTGPDSADTNWSVTANGVIKTGISNMTGADYSEEHAVVRLEVNFSSSVAGGGYEGQLRAKQNPTNNPYIALDAEL